MIKKSIVMIIGLFLLLALASCEIRKPDILPAIERKAYPKIIGIRVEPPSEVTFYTDGKMTDKEKRLMAESFLATVVIPGKDLWVNLRIEQRKRIAPYSLGITELGRVMLEQDYLLKKASSTAYYPENESGYRFWNVIDTYGSQRRMPSEIRVWIYPKEAVVVDSGRRMLIKSAELDVRQEKIKEGISGFQAASDEIILPQVREYVLYDRHFIPVRQIYRAVICAIWFKNKFPNTIYSRCINTNRTGSFEIPDADMKYKVWEKYALSFKNQDYQDPHPHKRRTWGGVDFKSPANWVEVEKREALDELKDADSFRISLEPSSIEGSQDTGASVTKGRIGGIELGCRIKVEEEQFAVTEDIAREWHDAASVSYILE
ncbi:MAG: hypothetical protein QME65_00955 [Candidatus Omnitrophota bacterium]|nr:hypothetical protein [Candidatus Omnitrophota bacterium]